MIHESRIHNLVDASPGAGSYVLYWMQQSQRTEYNHALSYASQKADELNLPLIVGFVLIPDFPDANQRHYQFMLQGVAEVRKNLEKMNIPFVLLQGEMVPSVLKMSETAAWVIADVGYTNVQRKWRTQVASSLSCPFSAVEADIIVPVCSASEKAETAARTLRPKLARLKDAFLDEPPVPEGRGNPRDMPFEPVMDMDPTKLSREHAINKEVQPVSAFAGGESAAESLLEEFTQNALHGYESLANDPVHQYNSHMSPYLHFGQISPLKIYKRIRGSNAPESSKAAYLEQLLVRRELAINFVYYNSGYDRYEDAIPEWAKNSLDKHRADPRPYIYSLEEFEKAKTGDPYWNAAQMEMMGSGKMHNYMRMYWGKKIIEWVEEPAEAFQIMLYLNNKYELDGRDPNSFSGVAWCFGRHDRPWQERRIFGKIRYMNDRGLKRKFRIDEYVRRIEQEYNVFVHP